MICEGCHQHIGKEWVTLAHTVKPDLGDRDAERRQYAVVCCSWTCAAGIAEDRYLLEQGR